MKKKVKIVALGVNSLGRGWILGISETEEGFDMTYWIGCKPEMIDSLEKGDDIEVPVNVLREA